MKILLVSFSANAFNPTPFTESLAGLLIHTKHKIVYKHYTRQQIHIARRQAADDALSMSAAAAAAAAFLGTPPPFEPVTHLAMIDDDQTFSPDALDRLLAHNVDVVSALAFQRLPPYLPTVFNWAVGDQVFHVPRIPEPRGLHKVDATGFPFTLIKTPVLEKLRPDWFGHWQPKNESERAPGIWCGEDVYFMARCRDAGIPVHVDTSLVVGHLGPPPVVTEETYRRYQEEQVRRALDKPSAPC